MSQGKRAKGNHRIRLLIADPVIVIETRKGSLTQSRNRSSKEKRERRKKENTSWFVCL